MLKMAIKHQTDRKLFEKNKSEPIWNRVPKLIFLNIVEHKFYNI